MINILFVCHGNICRSPMAEFVMKDMVKKRGLENEIICASAATSDEEYGNPVYPPARRKLAQHGIDCAGKTARQLTRADYDRFDLLIGMDEWNMKNLRRLFPDDPEHKLGKLLSLCGDGRDVADPWYTGDFEATWQDINKGCEALIEHITKTVGE